MKEKDDFEELLADLKNPDKNLRLKEAIKKLEKKPLKNLNNEEISIMNFISSMNSSEESNKLAKRMNYLTKWLIVATIVNAIAAVINVLFNVC